MGRWRPSPPAGLGDAGGRVTSEDRNGASGGWRRPPGAAERLELAREMGAAAGLCLDCRHLRLLRSGRSVFVRCWLAESDPGYPRYPVLPLGHCAGHEAWE